MFRFRFVVVLVCSFLLFGPAFAQQPASPQLSATRRRLPSFGNLSLPGGDRISPA